MTELKSDGTQSRPRPDREATPTPTPAAKITLLVTCLGAFMLMLDLTVVNVALPPIREDFGASFSQLQWVLDAYALGLAVLLVASGSFADRFGRRSTFAAGMAIFALASLACGLSPNMGSLIAARLVQGLAGAVLFAVGPALLGHAFPTGKARASAFGLFGAIGGFAVAFGPVIGGGLSDGLSWRWIFLINVPIGAIALLLTIRRIEESRAAAPPAMDLPGVVTFSLSLVALVLALLRGERQGWSSGQIVLLFIAAAVLAAAFVVIQVRKGDRAMFEKTLFKNVTFNGLNATTLIGNLTVLSSIFLFITYVQGVLGYSAWQSGLRILPLTIALFIGAAVAGPLSERLPYKYFFAASMIGIIVGLSLFLLVDPGDSWTTSLPLMIVLGLGLGVFNPVRAVLSVSLSRPERTGLTSGINETFQQVGVALGIAAFGAFFQNRAEHAFVSDSATRGLGAAGSQLAGAVPTGGGNAVRSVAGQPVPDAVLRAADSAFISSLHTTFVIAAAVAAVGLVVSLVAIRQKDVVNADDVHDVAVAT